MMFIAYAFSDALTADLVACQLAIEHIATRECIIEIVWPETTTTYSKQLQELIREAANHLNPSSVFHGREPIEIADFTSSARWAIKFSDKIIAEAGSRPGTSSKVCCLIGRNSTI
jgi:hypothetical protein